MHIAAIQIQKVYRGFVVRTRMRPKRAIFQHRNLIDNQIQDTEKRIFLLESQMRGLSQANASRMLQYESERRERAARVIQTHFKGYLARKVYSRATSPIKSVLGDDDKAVDSEDSRRKELQLWDADEEEMELENAIGSIVNRMHKDQFVHDSLLGLYGGVSREISVINQEISKDRKLTANSIVSKLQVLHSLLDDYYGKVDDNPSAGNLNNNLIAECSSLRNEIEDIVNIVKDVNSGNINEKSLEALLSFKVPPKLASVNHQENKRKSKLMNLNWWDLVELYCQNDQEVDSILELLHDEDNKSSSNNVYK